jgi:hypothetical protein
MSYLDVSPMITALRTSPDTFEFTRGGQLHHIPSQHRFQFDSSGQVRLDAQCSCSTLRVRDEQQAPLFQAFNEWRASYWRPLEINRQFAEHFDPPTGLRKFLLWLTARLHRALMTRSHREHERDKVAVPAE